MNKEDWIWVTIKIFGIYLIVLAITGLPELFINWVRVSPLSSMTTSAVLETGEECQLLADRIRTNSIGDLIGSLVSFLIFSSIGFYLIKSGKIIFNIINPKQD